MGVHTCCDLRFFSCLPPLGRTVQPITPMSGKGSRPRNWPRCACGNHAKVGGAAAREGRPVQNLVRHRRGSSVWDLLDGYL